MSTLEELAPLGWAAFSRSEFFRALDWAKAGGLAVVDEPRAHNRVRLYGPSVEALKIAATELGVQPETIADFEWKSHRQREEDPRTHLCIVAKGPAYFAALRRCREGAI